MDQATLKKYLHYNPLTGLFTWKKTTGKTLKGSRAGYVHKQKGGYINIGFQGKNLKAHRLAFLYMTGSIPKFVDHDDKDRSNNKWSNLKDATMTQNNKNCSKQHNNKSGVTGVSWSKERSRWVAQIGNQGKSVPLGRFIHKQDAINARRTAEKQFNYHWEHGQKPQKTNLTILVPIYQKTVITSKALSEYLNGATLQELTKKYEVSKRLLRWMHEYAKKTKQLKIFKAEQTRQHKIANEKIGLPQRQKVQQLALTGEVIKTHHSMLEAARVTGINQGNISNVCTGRQKTSGGFKWQLL